MEAIWETHDGLGGLVTIPLPAGSKARRVEVMVLAATDEGASGLPRTRRPAPGLAGTVMRDDLIEPAVASVDWDVLKCLARHPWLGTVAGTGARERAGVV